MRPCHETTPASQDLDETHLFISADIIETLQDRIDDLMDKLSFPLAEK